jgi:hypothetical protein
LALENIERDVRRMLADVNEQLAEAEQRLAQGAMREKVDAAGELVFLRSHKEMVEARLARLNAVAPAAAETPLRWLREEIFNLKLRVESWIAGG